MSYTIAVPALAGALFLVNAVLTLAVVRRLRAHTVRVDRLYDLVAAALDPAGRPFANVEPEANP
ncbi:MAG: hypothetical protein HOW71_25315 [Nonomuraea sp.]|nr:hypothetical protein [Nonomuraea sp.]NUP65485.1 hypothetical protein [Nonomuraea sp.]NUT43999.1 hypothetical protein [Thermoactinospora sp.]